MNSLVVVSNFILLLHICILVSRTSASEIGSSSCRYLGEFEEDGKKCRKDVVKLERLPVQCSSFVFNGVVCNPNTFDIVPKDSAYGLERITSLVKFENGAHRVYLFYTHGTVENWYIALLGKEFSTAAISVQNFIREYPVAGLILHGVEVRQSIEDEKYFYKDFVEYVKAIRDLNPLLEIGLYLSARLLTESSDGVNNIPYFDFLKINDILDFYIIEFATLNDCSNNLLHGGVTPMQSSDPNVMTLDMFATALRNSTISNDKLYFEFLISPEPKPEEYQNFKPCEISYNEYCENDDDKVNKWCADSPEILYSKGEFAAKYAKGFIGKYIDLVDRDNKCDCGKYVTFDIMVQGYNNDKNLITCDKLK